MGVTRELLVLEVGRSPLWKINNKKWEGPNVYKRKTFQRILEKKLSLYQMILLCLKNALVIYTSTHDDQKSLNPRVMTIKQNKKLGSLLQRSVLYKLPICQTWKEPTTILASNCVHACAANQNLEEWKKDPSDFHSFLCLFLFWVVSWGNQSSD